MIIVMNAEERAQLLTDVERAQAGGAPIAVVTVTHSGEPSLADRGVKLLVRRDPHDSSLGTLGDELLDARVADAAREGEGVLLQLLAGDGLVDHVECFGARGGGGVACVDELLGVAHGD